MKQGMAPPQGRDQDHLLLMWPPKAVLDFAIPRPLPLAEGLVTLQELNHD
jgi:hypothetical protein